MRLPRRPTGPTMGSRPSNNPRRGGYALQEIEIRRDMDETPRYAIAAAVQLPSVSDVEFAASLTELRELAKTLGFTVVRTFVQKRNGFDATAYLGVGKRQEIAPSSMTSPPEGEKRSPPPAACPAPSKSSWWTTRFRPPRRAIWKRKPAAK